MGKGGIFWSSSSSSVRLDLNFFSFLILIYKIIAVIIEIQIFIFFIIKLIVFIGLFFFFYIQSMLLIKWILVIFNLLYLLLFIHIVNILNKWIVVIRIPF